MHFYTKYSKEKIKIASKPFASGGEGELYRVVSPREYKHLAAKIYYPEKRSKEREQKIIYLIEHPPISVSQKQHAPIGWPIDTLYTKDFVGLLLPLLQGNKLTILTLSKLSRRADPAWQRFSLKNKEAFKLRLRLCFNIASTLYQIHNHQNYVLVDLKPDNILVQPNGLISIIDMDSVEVIENNKVLFPAPVATPEYTPAEKYTIERSVSTPVLESWDRFSMAVIFYQLLFGLHPFAASAKAPYDKLVGLDDKIRYGLFVHNPDIQEYFATIPPPHQKFKDIETLLKGLFLECFVIGHQHPESRPTAEEWCAYLINALNIPIQLEGINSFVRLAKNYKLPSSLVKFDQLAKVGSSFLTLKDALIPFEIITNILPQEKINAIQRLKLPEQQLSLIENDGPPEWLKNGFIIPYQLEQKERTRTQFFVAFFLLASLGCLSLGASSIAIILALPGAFLLVSSQYSKTNVLTNTKTFLEENKEDKLFLEQQQNDLELELQTLSNTITLYKENYQAPFNSSVKQYAQEINNYQQKLKEFNALLAQEDKKAKTSRKEEEKAYQDRRKIYEERIKSQPTLAKFNSTAYKYIKHLVNSQLKKANDGIVKMEQLLKEEKENYTIELDKLTGQFESQKEAAVLEFSLEFEKKLAAIDPSISNASYQKQVQELEKEVKTATITAHKLVEDKFNLLIEEVEKEQYDLINTTYEEQKNPIRAKIVTAIEELKKKKMNNTLFKQLSSRFAEELPIASIIQLFDKFQLPTVSLTEEKTAFVNAANLENKLTLQQKQIDDFLAVLQEHWLNLQKPLQKLQKNLVRSQLELNQSQELIGSLEDEYIEEANKSLVQQGDIAKNFDLIFRNIPEALTHKEEVLEDLTSYNLISILDLEDVDLSFHQFTYFNGLTVYCSKLEEEELKALKDYWVFIKKERTRLVQILKGKDSLLSKNKNHDVLRVELKKHKTIMLAALKGYETTAKQNITKLQRLYETHEQLFLQKKEKQLKDREANKESRYQRFEELQTQITLYQKELDTQTQKIAQEKEEEQKQKLEQLKEEQKQILINLQQEKLQLQEQFPVAKTSIIKKILIGQDTEKEVLKQTYKIKLLEHRNNIKTKQEELKPYQESLSFLEQEHQKLTEDIKTIQETYEAHYSIIQKEILARFEELKPLSSYLKNRLSVVMVHVNAQETRLEKLTFLLEQYQKIEAKHLENQAELAQQHRLQIWYDKQ